MVPLDKAMMVSYRLSIVTMPLSAAVCLSTMNAKLLPATIAHVHRITVSYPSVDAAFDIAASP